jgi:hypothetical protein
MQSFNSFDQMVAEKFNIKQLQIVLKRTIVGLPTESLGLPSNHCARKPRPGLESNPGHIDHRRELLLPAQL